MAFLLLSLVTAVAPGQSAQEVAGDVRSILERVAQSVVASTGTALDSIRIDSRVLTLVNRDSPDSHLRPDLQRAAHVNEDIESVAAAVGVRTGDMDKERRLCGSIIGSRRGSVPTDTTRCPFRDVRGYLLMSLPEVVGRTASVYATTWWNGSADRRPAQQWLGGSVVQYTLRGDSVGNWTIVGSRLIIGW